MNRSIEVAEPVIRAKNIENPCKKLIEQLQSTEEFMPDFSKREDFVELLDRSIESVLNTLLIKMNKVKCRMNTSVKLHKSSMLALLGAIIALISPILPWATIEFNPIAIPGSYPSYTPQNLILPTLNIPASGFETIIYPTFISFFLVVFSVALFANDERRRIARGLFIAAGGFVMLMTYVYRSICINLNRKYILRRGISRSKANNHTLQQVL